MTTILRHETERVVSGVAGRAMNVIADASGRIVNQEVLFSKSIAPHEVLVVRLRFDDSCKNGHATFSITGDVRDTRYKGDRGYISGGCIHDTIATHFPALAHLIPWHLCSTDGPMHYVGNAVYLAGDRDYNGLRAGEERQIRNGRTGQLAWTLERTSGDALPRHVDSDTRPDGTQTLSYVPWMRVGEGKARELDAARDAAVWPDATDADLCAEPDALKAALVARLPDLLARFRADMDACGFVWWEASKVTA